MIKYEKFLHRGQKHYRKRHIVRSKLYYYFCKFFFQCDIPMETQIDESVYFCHNAFGGVINPRAKIRGGVLQHSVTIGEIDDSHGAPVIEENVFIGARAIVLGNITVGKNAKVGAGAVVLKDVPPNTTVVGVPAYILEKN